MSAYTNGFKQACQHNLPISEILLCDKVEEFGKALKNIYNLDETVLFYNRMPDRRNFLLGTITNGSDKLPILMVG